MNVDREGLERDIVRIIHQHSALRGEKAHRIAKGVSALLAEAREEGKPRYHGQCEQCGHIYDDLMMAHLHEEDHGHTVVEDYSPASAGTEGPDEAAKQLLGALYMVRLLKAASHTLRSYEFGNSDPTGAKHMADQIDAALARPVEGEKHAE